MDICMEKICMEKSRVKEKFKIVIVIFAFDPSIIEPTFFESNWRNEKQM